jgi:hypothetical protein
MLTTFKTDTQELNLPTPNTAQALLSRENERNDSELPRCKKSSSDTELPNLAKDRRESELPSCTKFRTANEDPYSPTPKTDSELEIRP